MNDSETHSPSIDETRAPIADIFAPKALLKMGSAKQKLRQLVNKTSITSAHSNSPNQTQHQLSRHGQEATLSDAYSPAASRFSDSSHLFSTKVKQNASPKLKSTLNPKQSAKNSSQSIHMDLEPNKTKEIVKRTKPKATSYLGNLSLASSPKSGAYELFSSDINGTHSTKDSGFNPQNYMNFLATQPKTCQNKDNPLVRTNSFSDESDDEEDDGNLSLEIKMKPSLVSQHTKKRSNAKNLSQDSHSITSSLKYEAKEIGLAKGDGEKLKFKKSKSKLGKKTVVGDTTKKKTESLKAKISDGVKSPNAGMKLGKKSSLQISNATFYNMDKNKLEATDQLFNEKRRAVTPDNLTSRETEGNAPVESKFDKSPTKLGTIYNEILARKASMPVTKDIGPKKRLNLSNKEVKPKIGAKISKKARDTSQENTLESGIIKPKKSSTLDHLIPRTTKGSSPNIFGGLVTNVICSSTKNHRRGVNPQEFMHGEQEKNVISSNEVTVCGTQDTTVNMKGQNKKDITIEEYEEPVTKGKRFVRARSQGGSVLIEEILDDLNKGEKPNKSEVNASAKGVLPEKQYGNYKRSQGVLKSAEYKDVNWNILDKDRNSKEELIHNVLSVDSENASEQKGPEDSQTIDKVTVLCQLLERTNKVLSAYKDRETIWQSEKQELLNQIDRLQQGKGNMH